MKVTVYTITWNEEYMLPYFLLHYAYADRIVIYDNESDDLTREIASTNPMVSFRTFCTEGEQHNYIMQEVKNECWKGDESDFVIVVDCDEFFYPGDLLTQYAGHRVVFKPQGLQMVGTGEPLPAINRCYEWKKYAKRCCFSPHIDSINFSGGAHAARPRGHEAIVDGGVLRHYAYLSEQYVVDRWQRYAARMSQSDIKRRFAWEYRMPEQWIRQRYQEALRKARPC